MTQSSSQFIIFLHIQKTGGITLQRILRRKLGSPLHSRAIRKLTKPQQPQTLEAALKEKQMSDRYFAGHICFGTHRLLPQPFTYMTLLREPVSRIVSLYTYSCTNPTAYYHKQAINKSIEEFALKTQLMELDNGQVRFIAGDSTDLFINRTPIGNCSEELLIRAKQNIEQHFSFVGLTEYFDPSLLLLSKMMSWNNCFYLRRNVSQSKHKVLVSEDLHMKISQRNWLDVQLYDYVKNRFFKLLQRYGLDDEIRIKRFQRQNELFNTALNPPYTLYASLKAALQGTINHP